MNKGQRIADSEMRYLGAAWRSQYDGPSRNPISTSIWRQIRQQIRILPRIYDEERITELHGKWLRVADRDRYSAAVLLLHYRDGYDLDEGEILHALDLYRWS